MFYTVNDYPVLRTLFHMNVNFLMHFQNNSEFRHSILAEIKHELMKKIFLVIVIASLSAASIAQPLTTKNGSYILPQAGDWSIGADASPFLEFVGNMFNGTLEQSSPNWDFVSSGPELTLFGKYCVTDGKFYRARLRLACLSDRQHFVVTNKRFDMDTVLFNDEYLTDKTKTTTTNVNLAGGIEFRKGRGRVQGYCGPELWIGYESSKTTNEFANPTDSDMTALSGAIFNYTAIPGAISAQGKRITEIKNGSTFSFGVRGFVGVECFFAPKISLGGEFGWGIGISRTGQGETTTEYFQPDLGSFNAGVRMETVPGPGKSSLFNLDMDNAMGALTLHFYVGNNSTSR